MSARCRLTHHHLLSEPHWWQGGRGGDSGCHCEVGFTSIRFTSIRLPGDQNRRQDFCPLMDCFRRAHHTNLCQG